MQIVVNVAAVYEREGGGHSHCFTVLSGGGGGVGG